jgi:hypothetical protein
LIMGARAAVFLALVKMPGIAKVYKGWLRLPIS